MSPPQSDAVIFIGGAPGTGKSSVAKLLATNVPGLRVATAGALIRQRLGGGTEYRRPPVADVDHAVFLQDVLVDAFGVVRGEHVGPILLDGHYAVPTADGPAALPASVFRRLGCTHLVVIEAPPTVELANRLRARGGAAWWDGSEEALVRLVEADRTNAVNVATTLGLALQIGDDADATTALVRRLLRGE